MCRGLSGPFEAIHMEEVRGVDHGRKDVAVLRHFGHVLPRVVEIHLALPSHHSKDIERNQHAKRMKLAVGAREEVNDHVLPLPVRVLGSESG